MLPPIRSAWCIARSPGDVKALARTLDIDPRRLKWLDSPDRLAGTRDELVFILPNWWMAGDRYARTEQMLNAVQARVRVVYTGPERLRPRYKNSPSGRLMPHGKHLPD